MTHFHKDIAHLIFFIFLHFIFLTVNITFYMHKKTEDIDSSVFSKIDYLYLKLLITFVTPGRDLYSSALPEESITIIFLHPARYPL